MKRDYSRCEEGPDDIASRPTDYEREVERIKALDRGGNMPNRDALIARIREALEEYQNYYSNWKGEKALSALDQLAAQRPTVPEDALRLLYNMAALNGPAIPDNRDEIIKAHMAEFGVEVSE
jgi:hypothetical protein